MSKTKCLYRVLVDYPGEHYWNQAAQRAIRRAAGGYSDGSGMDLRTGRRDESWYKNTKAAAVKIERKLKALKLKGLRVKVKKDCT